MVLENILHCFSYLDTCSQFISRLTNGYLTHKLPKEAETINFNDFSAIFCFLERLIKVNDISYLSQPQLGIAFAPAIVYFMSNS